MDYGCAVYWDGSQYHKLIYTDEFREQGAEKMKLVVGKQYTVGGDSLPASYWLYAKTVTYLTGAGDDVVVEDDSGRLHYVPARHLRPVESRCPCCGMLLAGE